MPRNWSVDIRSALVTPNSMLKSRQAEVVFTYIDQIPQGKFRIGTPPYLSHSFLSLHKHTFALTPRPSNKNDKKLSPSPKVAFQEIQLFLLPWSRGSLKVRTIISASVATGKPKIITIPIPLTEVNKKSAKPLALIRWQC